MKTIEKYTKHQLDISSKIKNDKNFKPSNIKKRVIVISLLRYMYMNNLT